MTVSDTLKSVLVVPDADLKVNGGRYTLQQGPAIKVRGFRSDNLGGRKVKGGEALPVYVLTEADIRANGGRWRVGAGEARQMTDVIGDARGIIQCPAIPVFPVDDNGDFDLWWGSYAARVLVTEPNDLIGYWIMDKAAGGVSVDSSPEGNDGAYTNVTLGEPGIGDGRTCPLFTVSYNNVYSVPLRTDFNPSEGTLIAWVKMRNSGVWIDGDFRRAVYLSPGNVNNRIIIQKHNANNNVRLFYVAGGVTKSRSMTGLTTLDWMHLAITWSVAADEVRVYMDGEQQGATQTGLGVWVGNLSSTETNIGALNTTGTNPWRGWLAHVSLSTTPLTPAQILAIYNAR